MVQHDPKKKRGPVEVRSMQASDTSAAFGSPAGESIRKGKSRKSAET